jgi:hypothetical protein
MREWKLKPSLTLLDIHREIRTNSCKALSVTGFNSQFNEFARSMKLIIGNKNK